MFTDAELASMREDAEEALPETDVQVRRYTKTGDGQGGRTRTLATVATVAGRKSPATAAQIAESAVADRLTGRAAWTWILPHGTDVTGRDILTDDEGDYEVLSVAGPRSYQIALRVVTVQVK